VGVAGEDARIGLAHHLPHARHHAFQFPTQPLQHDLPPGVSRPLGPRVRIHFPPAESRANHRFLSGGAHVPHSLALRPRQLGDTRRGRTRRHGESVAQTRGQRQVGLLAAGEGGRLITTSGPKSAVVLESSLADNIASPANDIERGGLLGIAIPNRRGRWQSCSKTALVSFGRSRR
jgi:hypothetical protein